MRGTRQGDTLSDEEHNLNFPLNIFTCVLHPVFISQCVEVDLKPLLFIIQLIPFISKESLRTLTQLCQEIYFIHTVTETHLYVIEFDWVVKFINVSRGQRFQFGAVRVEQRTYFWNEEVKHVTTRKRKKNHHAAV